MARLIGEMPVVEHEGAIEHARIRIDQKLVRIEAVTALRVIWTMDAIAIALSRHDARNIPVPDISTP